jgi:hypothetical protein
MRFHAKYVSASEAGDYYQVSFDTEDPGKDSTDPRGPDTPYLIIQRQFETLGGRTEVCGLVYRTGRKCASAGDIRLVSHLCLRRVHVDYCLAHWLALRSLSRADDGRTMRQAAQLKQMH